MWNAAWFLGTPGVRVLQDAGADYYGGVDGTPTFLVPVLVII
jgi:hypothetical protein